MGVWYVVLYVDFKTVQLMEGLDESEKFSFTKAGIRAELTFLFQFAGFIFEYLVKFFLIPSFRSQTALQRLKHSYLVDNILVLSDDARKALACE